MEINKNTTAWEIWTALAESDPEREAVIHWIAGEEPFRWKRKELLQTAKKFSLCLKSKGIKRNDVCAIIIKHNRMFYPLYMGIVGIGALPAVLAYPNPRLHPDKFRQGLEGMSQRSGLDWILTQKDMEDIIRPFSDRKESTIKELLFPLEWDTNSTFSDEEHTEVDAIRSEIKPEEPMLLQHSSGTTGLQKPVVLSHKAVITHVKNYSDSLNFSYGDKIVSWLPLYHDMGLIAAFHMPLLYGIPVIQVDPFEWVVAPSLICEALSQEKATLTWLPNFAYNFMADRIDDDELEGISFESIRMIINCSEPVRAESHHKFYNRFSRFGLKENKLASCYAMAETTFAVSQSAPGSNSEEITVDRDLLSEGKVIRSDNAVNRRVCVSSGKLIEGCKVKIVDDNRKDVGIDRVGEIAIQSVSMFDGYRNYPEKTALVLDDEGWYYSGDFGFMHNDELYVIGRKKDIIIEAGNNIYPEDVEDAVNKAEGVIPGRVIAFGEEDPELGTEHVSVVAETREARKDLQKVKMAVIKAGMEINVNIKNVYLVPPRWLIKSSAGKPSRKANKHRILNKEFDNAWSS
ncbi:MAG: AMP-binding protein [Melioribacteraceae bacterium]|nr:AMP-binding protein [Melioribacteraceae bacterium]